MVYGHSQGINFGAWKRRSSQRSWKFVTRRITRPIAGSHYLDNRPPHSWNKLNYMTWFMFNFIKQIIFHKFWWLFGSIELCLAPLGLRIASIQGNIPMTNPKYWFEVGSIWGLPKITMDPWVRRERNNECTYHRKAKVRWVGFTEPSEFDRTLVYLSGQANTSDKKLLIPRWDQRCQKTEVMQVPLGFLRTINSPFAPELKHSKRRSILHCLCLFELG